jgi:hypothetical protein
MTPQEAQMLQDLVRKVESTQLTEKDPDAEALLNDGLARDPDSLYKLAQTVLIQNIALDQARAQMQRMQQQLAPPPPQYQAAPPTYPPPPGYAYPPPSASGGGFLRSAATTAAGVAGGMLAFEGVESLLHHGMGGGYGEFGAMPQETIINNYYDDPSQQGGGDPNSIPGPDEQPQGPYDNASDDAQGYLDDSGAGDDGSSAADFAADAGGDDADDSGGFDQV